MAEQRRSRPVMRLEVLRTARLTPHLIRVVCGGEGLATFTPNGYTDAYVKLIFPAAGVSYPEPFDMRTIRETMPREDWPTMRTYTVRSFDAAAGELVLDVVFHGNEGIAGPWAARLSPGDDVLLAGPGGAYAPSADADWHLMVGDESALPAIAASLETVPADVPVRVIVLVEDAAEELPLATEADAHVQWLHSSAGDDIVVALRSLEFPSGTVHAFVHGEAGFVRELRLHLLAERGVRKDMLSISGYWRRGRADEAWRAEKQAFMA